MRSHQPRCGPCPGELPPSPGSALPQTCVTQSPPRPGAAGLRPLTEPTIARCQHSLARIHPPLCHQKGMLCPACHSRGKPALNQTPGPQRRPERARLALRHSVLGLRPRRAPRRAPRPGTRGPSSRSQRESAWAPPGATRPARPTVPQQAWVQVALLRANQQQTGARPGPGTPSPSPPTSPSTAA